MKKEVDFEVELSNAMRKLLQNKILSGEITVKDIASEMGVSVINVYRKLENYDKFKLRDLNYILTKWGNEINYYLDNFVIITGDSELRGKLLKLLKNN